LIALFVLIAACFIRSPRDIFGFTSMKDRGAMWTTGAEIFKKHPIIGNGINTFFGLYREMRNDEWKGEKGSYAHNCYLQMAADTGVLGLGAFLLFIAALIGRAVRFLRIKGDPFYHSLGTGLVIGLSAFLMHSFFDTNLYSLNLASLFWISSGILASVLNVARNEETLR
jgi:O-antigen ligase